MASHAERTTKTYDQSCAIGSLLLEAEALKLEIDQRSQRLDELKGKLLAHALRYGLDNLALEGHPILAQHKAKTTWAYSEAVKTIQDRLKMAQAAEQRNGKATKTETPYISLNFRQAVILQNQVSLC